MKKYILLFSLVAFCGSVLAQTGKVFDNLTVTSKILNSERKFAIYLPPDYETSQRSYPVLYLLHGAGDDQTGWVQFGEVLRIADQAILDGSSTAMIIVMPDADTGVRGYFNTIDGKWNYEDFFFQELMPYVEKTYRIKQDKRYRAIAGLSMGGGGTFIYALHRPDLFSSACPLSASTGPLTPEAGRGWLERTGTKNPTDAQLKEYYDKFSVPAIIDIMDADALKSVKWFIDCGDDDFLYEGNSLVHIALRKKEVPHEFRIRDGGHNWTYWRTSLPVVLSFVSDTFHQK